MHIYIHHHVSVDIFGMLHPMIPPNTTVTNVQAKAGPKAASKAASKASAKPKGAPGPDIPGKVMVLGYLL